eukprot:TRINITY_DN1325_c0_g2_i1.p1 TRINITY_DN1325_c0_g2~~TRINITY_DN1325_c0_g2_i1.p1  ORF type:complete len:898 (+),score=239.68 TRINITY_DN1325_c0_g2_i1:142-2835(+)
MPVGEASDPRQIGESYRALMDVEEHLGMKGQSQGDTRALCVLPDLSHRDRVLVRLVFDTHCSTLAATWDDYDEHSAEPIKEEMEIRHLKVDYYASPPVLLLSGMARRPPLRLQLPPLDSQEVIIHKKYGLPLGVVVVSELWLMEVKEGYPAWNVLGGYLFRSIQEVSLEEGEWTPFSGLSDIAEGRKSTYYGVRFDQDSMVLLGRLQHFASQCRARFEAFVPGIEPAGASGRGPSATRPWTSLRDASAAELQQVFAERDSPVPPPPPPLVLNEGFDEELLCLDALNADDRDWLGPITEHPSFMALPNGMMYPAEVDGRQFPQMPTKLLTTAALWLVKEGEHMIGVPPETVDRLTVWLVQSHPTIMLHSSPLAPQRRSPSPLPLRSGGAAGRAEPRGAPQQAASPVSDRGNKRADVPAPTGGKPAPRPSAARQTKQDEWCTPLPAAEVSPSSRRGRKAPTTARAVPAAPDSPKRPEPWRTPQAEEPKKPAGKVAAWQPPQPQRPPEKKETPDSPRRAPLPEPQRPWSGDWGKKPLSAAPREPVRVEAKPPPPAPAKAPPPRAGGPPARIGRRHEERTVDQTDDGKERRVAQDGRAYTYDEFMAWSGIPKDWDHAKRAAGHEAAGAEFKGAVGGSIWLCSGETQSECLSKRLFGLPCGQTTCQVASLVREGDHLFLLNFIRRVLMGPFVATSDVKWMLDSTAWSGQWGETGRKSSRFPVQVRARLQAAGSATAPRELSERQFKGILGGNLAGGKVVNHILSPDQVQALIEQFRTNGVLPKPGREGASFDRPANRIAAQAAENAGSEPVPVKMTSVPTAKSKGAGARAAPPAAAAGAIRKGASVIAVVDVTSKGELVLAKGSRAVVEEVKPEDKLQVSLLDQRDGKQKSMLLKAEKMRLA